MEGSVALLPPLLGLVPVLRLQYRLHHEVVDLTEGTQGENKSVSFNGRPLRVNPPMVFLWFMKKFLSLLNGFKLMNISYAHCSQIYIFNFFNILYISSKSNFFSSFFSGIDIFTLPYLMGWTYFSVSFLSDEQYRILSSSEENWVMLATAPGLDRTTSASHLENKPRSSLCRVFQLQTCRAVSTAPDFNIVL